MIAVSHGKCGDLVYGLSAALALGCDSLALYDGEWGKAEDIKLRLQNLVSTLHIECPKHELDPALTISLDKFRQCPRLFQQHFTWSHCEMLGVDRKVLNKPWIKVEPNPQADIVIARGFHTRSHFPYEQVCRNLGGDDCTVGFVGLIREFEDFERQFPACNAQVVFASNLHELARVIAGAKHFIGNQSAPLAIAEAMHHPSIHIEIGVPAQYQRPWHE